MDCAWLAVRFCLRPSEHGYGWPTDTDRPSIKFSPTVRDAGDGFAIIFVVASGWWASSPTSLQTDVATGELRSGSKQSPMTMPSHRCVYSLTSCVWSNMTEAC